MNAEIKVSVHYDATNPNIRTSIGFSAYALERDAMVSRVNHLMRCEVFGFHFMLARSLGTV
jgi:hypothetical protein